MLSAVAVPTENLEVIWKSIPDDPSVKHSTCTYFTFFSVPCPVVVPVVDSQPSDICNSTPAQTSTLLTVMVQNLLLQFARPYFRLFASLTEVCLALGLATIRQVFTTRH